MAPPSGAGRGALPSPVLPVSEGGDGKRRVGGGGRWPPAMADGDAGTRAPPGGAPRLHDDAAPVRGGGAERNGASGVAPDRRACLFFLCWFGTTTLSRRANGRPVLVTRTATRDATASGWAGPAASRTADRRGTSSGANAETEKKRTARLVFRGASATATDTKMEQPVAPYAAEQQLVRKEKKKQHAK